MALQRHAPQLVDHGHRCPDALLAEASSGGASTNATALDPADAQWAVAQAISWWAPQANVERLRNMHVYVSDLPAGYLGLAWGRNLTLDVNANGAGWFVDAAGQYAAFSAVPSSANRQMDLLTVVAHEVGHLLGYDHSENVSDVMAATLSVGTRRVPGTATRLLADSRELVVVVSAAGPRIAVDWSAARARGYPLLLPPEATARVPTPRRGCSAWCPRIV